MAIQSCELFTFVENKILMMGLTKKEFCSKVDLSINSIQRLKVGYPDDRTIIKIANGLEDISLIPIIKELANKDKMIRKELKNSIQ